MDTAETKEWKQFDLFCKSKQISNTESSSYVAYFYSMVGSPTGILGRFEMLNRRFAHRKTGGNLWNVEKLSRSMTRMLCSGVDDQGMDKGKKDKDYFYPEDILWIAKDRSHLEDNAVLLSKTIVLIGIFCLATPRELSQLTFEDVELGRNEVHVIIKRSNCIQKIAIGDEKYADVIRRYIQESRIQDTERSDRKTPLLCGKLFKTPYLYKKRYHFKSQDVSIQTLHKHVKKIALMANLPNSESFTIHSLRRSGAELIGNLNRKYPIIRIIDQSDHLSFNNFKTSQSSTQEPSQGCSSSETRFLHEILASQSEILSQHLHLVAEQQKTIMGHKMLQHLEVSRGDTDTSGRKRKTESPLPLKVPRRTFYTCPQRGSHNIETNSMESFPT